MRDIYVREASPFRSAIVSAEVESLSTTAVHSTPWPRGQEVGKGPMGERVFVGHLVFYIPKGAERVVVSRGGDWNSGLLAFRKAVAITKQGQTPKWTRFMARSIAETGSYILHFYRTDDQISVDDCEAECERAAELRVLLRHL